MPVHINPSKPQNTKDSPTMKSIFSVQNNLFYTRCVSTEKWSHIISKHMLRLESLRESVLMS